MQMLELAELPQPELGPTAVTIGVFDGVHRGHRALIRSTVAAARERGLRAVALTFDPHPAAYFTPEHAPAWLCTLDHRRALVEAEGVDALVTLRFDEELAALTPEAYVDEVLQRRLGAKLVYVGPSFTFGSGRKGTPAWLVRIGEERGIEVQIQEKIRHGHGAVTSTRVRAALARGHVTEAATLLGRRHMVEGKIVRGSGAARGTGFPTINLALERGMLPAAGIYSALGRLDGAEYPAAVYIRDRDARADGLVHVEAHLRGLSGQHYGERAGLAFLHYLRRDLIFESDAELRQRIDRDCKRAWRDAERFAEDDASLPLFWGE